MRARQKSRTARWPNTVACPLTGFDTWRAGLAESCGTDDYRCLRQSAAVGLGRADRGLAGQCQAEEREKQGQKAAKKMNNILHLALDQIAKISILLNPIIPNSSLKALKIFNLSENDINFSSIANNEFLIKDNKINKIDILFKKIEKNND